MVIRLGNPLSPCRDEGLLKVSHESLTDRGAVCRRALQDSRRSPIRTLPGGSGRTERLVEGDWGQVPVPDESDELVIGMGDGRVVCVPEQDYTWLDVPAGLSQEPRGAEQPGVAKGPVPQQRPCVPQVGGESVGALVMGPVWRPPPGTGCRSECPLNPLVVALEFFPNPWPGRCVMSGW